MAICIAIVFLIIMRNNLQHQHKPKLACIYAYYEKSSVYKENLQYFIRHGLDAPNMDYYIVINGECTVSIPPNVTVIQRENKGYDFGAWSHALALYPMDEYDYVFFLNTSVRGPYRKDWTTPFLRRFTGATKIVGTSINISHTDAKVSPHVQSMFFCLDRESLRFLKEQGFFDASSVEGKSFWEVISDKEIGMSQRLLRHGWNIDCVLSKYQGLDYRTITKDINPTSVSGDPYYVGAYFGGTITPKEAIFFKNTRFI